MDHIAANRAAWNHMADGFAEAGRRCWASEEPVWGVFSIPESQVGLLTEDLYGKRTIELGCGTAYVSAWLARRGATPTGIDLSEEQLRTARELQDEHELRFPLIQGNAEATPFEDESFDFGISEYGAAIWCDPYAWIPEAHRILRPGAGLVFLTNGLLQVLTMPVSGDQPSTDRLLYDYFGMHRYEWIGDDHPSVEFHLGFGDWLRLFRKTGFEVEDFIELRPAAGASTDFEYVTPEWARRWPAEQAWKLRKRGA